MFETSTEALLLRVAEALERLSPTHPNTVSLEAADAFVWHAEGEFFEPITLKPASRIGLDYVSCSPYRVPVARLAAAQAQLNKKN